MSIPHRAHAIKKAQMESSLLRLISELLLQAALETPSIAQAFITRVELSPGKTLCRVFFYTPKGNNQFQEILEDIKLYKPSIRHAIAQTFRKKYTVDLLFCFDEQFEKTQRIESLIEKLKE